MKMQDVLRYEVLRRLINNLLQAVYSQIPNFLFKPIDVHTTNQLMFKTEVAPHWLRVYNKKTNRENTLASLKSCDNFFFGKNSF